MTTSPESLDPLFDNNRRFVERMKAKDPAFFETSAKGQSPPYLWFGCADSRVPPSTILGLDPGQVFVHRNIANVVGPTDLSALSVLQYAVEALGVRHIIVCGHYGCGGVAAAMGSKSYGLLDNWLRPIKDVYHAHRDDDGLTPDRLSELNVAAQVQNVCRTPIVQAAWRSGRNLSVHGWIYSLADGTVRDLGLSAHGLEAVPPPYRLDP